MSIALPSIPALPDAFKDVASKAMHFETVIVAHLAALSPASLNKLKTALDLSQPLHLPMLEAFRAEIAACLPDAIILLNMFTLLTAANSVGIKPAE